MGEDGEGFFVDGVTGGEEGDRWKGLFYEDDHEGLG